MAGTHQTGRDGCRSHRREPVKGAACPAHATHRRALQLLRRERKSASSTVRAPGLHGGLAQVAEPKKSASEQDLARVQRTAAASPAATGVGSRTDLDRASWK